MHVCVFGQVGARGCFQPRSDAQGEPFVICAPPQYLASDSSSLRHNCIDGMTCMLRHLACTPCSHARVHARASDTHMPKQPSCALARVPEGFIACLRSHATAERDGAPAHGPRHVRDAAGRDGALPAHARPPRPLGPRHRPRRHRHAGAPAALPAPWALATWQPLVHVTSCSAGNKSAPAMAMC